MAQAAHFFPVALLLEGRTCLVVGSDDEAERRVRALCEAGARVKLVASSPSPSLRSFAADEPRVELLEAGYETSQLDDAWLVVLADRDEALAERMGDDCERKRLFFCAVDQPRKNSFSHVGIARASALTLAISTDGKAPALARRLKKELERLFAESRLAEFVDRVAAARSGAQPDVRARLTTELANRLRFTGSIVIDEE
jgi:precorrin-2 dehydrogenase/sirohydrochlorin ferrochelatase